MVEDWIDALCARWGTITPAPPFGRRVVRAYNPITNADVPESIDPAGLVETPVAFTLPPSLRPLINKAGPKLATWTGTTHFHLAPSMEWKWVRELMPWYALILNAAAGSPQLGGKVHLFQIPDEDEALSELQAVQYGDESPHWGIVVKWVVIEHVSQAITVGEAGT